MASTDPKSGPQAENSAPNTIPWPPIIYIGAAIVALAFHQLAPLPWPKDPWRMTMLMAGVFLIVCALAIELSTALVFRRHRTTILPHRSATRLITTGPFAWSRNPIYLANTMLLTGAGLTFGVAWLVLTAPCAATLTYLLAIRREEQHLARLFGEAWHNYALQTRRWFGWR